jgi:hypothetical protein
MQPYETRANPLKCIECKDNFSKLDICTTCGGICGDCENEQLLCDDCDNRFHIIYHTPPLMEVDGDWCCPSCKC